MLNFVRGMEAKVQYHFLVVNFVVIVRHHIFFFFFLVVVMRPIVTAFIYLFSVSPLNQSRLIFIINYFVTVISYDRLFAFVCFYSRCFLRRVVVCFIYCIILFFSLINQKLSYLHPHFIIFFDQYCAKTTNCQSFHPMGAGKSCSGL